MSHDAHASNDSHADHDSHDTHHVNYLAIFGVLCVCTALSVIFDVIHLSKAITIVLVLSVAVTKALCVMMFFMHLKFEGNWKFVLLAPTTILAIGLPLALYPDVGASYYTPTAPQVTSWAEEINEYQQHHAEHVDDASHAEPAPAEPEHAE
jgi:cytochrome c oxidase subunit IV